jgi:hypothetical protein
MRKVLVIGATVGLVAALTASPALAGGGCGNFNTKTAHVEMQTADSSAVTTQQSQSTQK